MGAEVEDSEVRIEDICQELSVSLRGREHTRMDDDTLESIIFFFFQAEDGIRDLTVTGVQTCALPISTHLYALLSATMFDAQIGCWDAKETYWFLRPWQADPLITVVAAVGKPNHPAYPSGPSCLSASGADVLSTFFPEQRDHLNAMVTEAEPARTH